MSRMQSLVHQYKQDAMSYAPIQAGCNVLCTNTSRVQCLVHQYKQGAMSGARSNILSVEVFEGYNSIIHCSVSKYMVSEDIACRIVNVSWELLHTKKPQSLHIT